MTARDRYLSCMPNFHIDFQCSAAMPMLMTGGTLILLEKYSARRFWRQVCLHRATLSHAMPLIVRTLMLQPPRAQERNHCLRDLFSTSTSPTPRSKPLSGALACVCLTLTV